jgi:hypothetical protein
MSSNEAPNWKKGDIVCLINHNNNVIHIFEAEHDPYYGKTFFSSNEDWYYGLRDCKEIRLATIEDIDYKIVYQKENVEREKAHLDQLLNFRERLSNE